MDLSWIGSGEEQGLAEWDEFLMNSPRGSYCQLSSWLASFRPYGFGYEVLVARPAKGGPILGGLGCLRIGGAGVRVAMAPVGPLVEHGCEESIAPLLAEAAARAKKKGAALFEYLLPAAEAPNEHLLAAEKIGDLSGAKRGWPVSAGQAPAQMLWVDYSRVAPDADWDDAMLKTFDAATRRNVRTSLKHNLTAREAQTKEELRSAWAIVEQNGEAQGYTTRSWRDFGPSVTAQVHKGQALVMTAWLDRQLLGCVYGILAGRRFSYMMGGTVRTDQDYKVGHYTHWQAMKRAKALGLRGYDFTSGGPPGVMRFKLGFNPQHIQFPGPRHVVLRPVQAAIVTRLYPVARRRKQQLLTLASRLSKSIGR